MMKRITIIGFSVAICSCSLDSTGTGVYTVPDIVEDVPLVGDSLPRGAVSFFKKLACPEGWRPYEEARGRTIVAAVEGFASGEVMGEALSSQEERSHQHTISAMIEIEKISYVGSPGGGNSGVAEANTVTMSTMSTHAPTDVPYVQLLVCTKVSDAVPRPTPLPRGMLMFFDKEVCPANWKPAEETGGRLLVGLPKNALADRPFGGAPFTSTEPRVHDHAFASTLETSSHGVALASGCCGDGYAKNGTYEVSAQTGPANVEVPVLALLQCEKE